VTFKPGRLRRVLDPIVSPGNYAFAMFSTDLGGLYENVIESISVYRGKSDRGGGSFPAVLEVRLRGRYSAAVAGQNVRVFLRDSAADALAAHCGTTRDAIKTRFTGRLGATSVDDDGKTFSTTYGASSWIAQMNYSPVHYAPTAGQSIGAAIAGLAQASDPLRGITVTQLGSFDKIATNQPNTLFREGVAKYAEDIGILLRETRDGITEVFGHEYRSDLALTRGITELPIMRTHAISPASWKQPNERPGIQVDFTIVNASGGLTTRSASVANPTGELRETVEIDWSWFKENDVDNQAYREAYGRVYEATSRQFRIESVKIDMLRLLASPKEYQRRLAGQLLALEHGDPVFFASDWPSELRGVHFAEGIKETINSDTWDIDLDLVPYAQAIGYAPSPIVQARGWDSAPWPWDDMTIDWNSA
jgi:hypothetical protein